MLPKPPHLSVRTRVAHQPALHVRLAPDPAEPAVRRSDNGNYARRLELSAADVHRFVAWRVANHADAADIAQQTLLQACLKLSTFRGENFSAWVLTIARHLIVDYYRARNRFQFVEVGQAALTEAEPALRIPPDAVLTVCEWRERLNDWLDDITHGLRLEQQVAVLLADLYGHSDKDSAAVLLMSVPRFKLLLHGARARLQEIASGHGPPVMNASARRVGVSCPGRARKLRALRRQLLNGVAA
jgi:RNA polymerase sigma factor (sigma-70 family)